MNNVMDFSSVLPCGQERVSMSLEKIFQREGQAFLFAF